MRIADVVKQATSEINQLVKEVRDSDEDDPGKLAGLFDKVSERADKAAGLLSKADAALGNGNGKSENGDDEDAEDGEQDEAEQPQAKPRQRKQQPEQA